MKMYILLHDINPSETEVCGCFDEIEMAIDAGKDAIDEIFYSDDRSPCYDVFYVVECHRNERLPANESPDVIWEGRVPTRLTK